MLLTNQHIDPFLEGLFLEAQYYCSGLHYFANLVVVGIVVEVVDQLVAVAKNSVFELSSVTTKTMKRIIIGI